MFTRITFSLGVLAMLVAHQLRPRAAARADQFDGHDRRGKPRRRDRRQHERSRRRCIESGGTPVQNGTTGPVHDDTRARGPGRGTDPQRHRDDDVLCRRTIPAWRKCAPRPAAPAAARRRHRRHTARPRRRPRPRTATSCMIAVGSGAVDTVTVRANPSTVSTGTARTVTRDRDGCRDGRTTALGHSRQLQRHARNLEQPQPRSPMRRARRASR